MILRSDRTSDPANLAAIDPESYTAVAPLDPTTAKQLRILVTDQKTVLLSKGHGPVSEGGGR